MAFGLRTFSANGGILVDAAVPMQKVIYDQTLTFYTSGGAPASAHTCDVNGFTGPACGPTGLCSDNMFKIPVPGYYPGQPCHGAYMITQANTYGSGTYLQIYLNYIGEIRMCWKFSYTAVPAGFWERFRLIVLIGNRTY